MSRPPSTVRAGDIPVEQAALLRTIQQLAARTARLRQRMLSADMDVTKFSEMLTHIEGFTQQRKHAEASADRIGIPAQWIKRAQEFGLAGQEWSDEQRFPKPARPRGRRVRSRLIQDTRQLTDMAVIAAVRTHRLTIAGIEREPAPTAARQFRANMRAVWACTSGAADALRLTRQEPGSPWEITDAELRDLVGRYADLPLASLDEAWRRYAAPHIAEKAHNSLTELRRTLHTAAKPSSAVEWEEPPRPDALITRAQDALHTLLRDRLFDEPPRTRRARGVVAPVGSAITDIMPAKGNFRWYAAPHLNNPPASPAEPQRDLGVDR
ncbi:hypothetical protein IU450_36040 [Nocardia abscessus]|uniref:hypothetical protein n=1 Tax=Nocardia abscessus TaxID=120957 RepID=UPI0018948C5D|nr:hypothetical protein [Nocardia abscessus]MBF6341253.1 hypothetical protein [Nocardia abscessus]